MAVPLSTLASWPAGSSLDGIAPEGEGGGGLAVRVLLLLESALPELLAMDLTRTARSQNDIQASHTAFQQDSLRAGDFGAEATRAGEHAMEMSKP